MSDKPETGISVTYFGWDSDANWRLEEWLRVMCQGCVRDKGRGEAGGAGGMSCLLPGNAYADVPVAEWSPDASPKPERFAELGDGPWPVCLAFEARKKRSDAGTRRAPKNTEPLFEVEAS